MRIIWTDYERMWCFSNGFSVTYFIKIEKNNDKEYKHPHTYVTRKKNLFIVSRLWRKLDNIQTYISYLVELENGWVWCSHLTMQVCFQYTNSRK